MTIVDTSVWIEYLGGRVNPETEWLDAKVGNWSLGLTDLILCEVLQGIRDDAAFARVRRQLGNFEIVRGGGETLAVQAAMNFRYLRAKGITVRKTVDCWIATVCLEGGYSLLHRDRDFDAFEQQFGLQVIHP